MSRTRTLSFAAMFAVSLGGVMTIWLHAQQANDRALPSLFPPRALLYLEAKDLKRLLSQWNGSAEKAKWLASDNFGVLSRSRLIGRLAEAQTEFETVAGVPVEFSLSDELAGSRSAFAFYDLAQLTFVYLTQLDNSKVDVNRLWRNRSQYQSREVAGISFFEKSDAATHRTVCFGSYRGWFVVATAEEQMAATLVLLSGAKQPSLSDEEWFKHASSRSAAQGDLRLVYNLDDLLATPQFRTYWIQRNASELKPFVSGIADLFEEQSGFREDRLLFRRTEESAAAATPHSLEGVLHFAPANASLYRAWANPSENEVRSALQQVVLSESPGRVANETYAPTVSAEGSAVGSVSDLETSIDTPPLAQGAGPDIGPVSKVIAAMSPLTMLHVQRTESYGDKVFVVPQSGVVIECAHPDFGNLQRAISSTVRLEKTAKLDALDVSVSGNTLIVSRMPLRSENTQASIDAGVSYTARYNHAAEWPNYKQTFALIDRNAVAGSPAAMPTFFSGNVRSLGDVFSRLRSARIDARNSPEELHETMRYEMTAP